MILINVSVITSSANRDNFIIVLDNIIKKALQLKGCISYEWFNKQNDKNQFVIYAEFDTEENFLNYRKSEIIQMIGKQLLPLLTEKPKFKHIRAEVFEQD